jgi:hemoglobin
MWKAFHGQAGVDRIVDETVDRSLADPRISDIFKGHDLVRLRRTVKEQFCFILNGGCDYSGRDMKATHKDMGLQNADFNAFVEHLQLAMDREKIGFRDQNRFLAKLAPMQRTTVER